MNKKDFKDWYVMLHMGGVLLASTWFVFLHPTYFADWCALVGTIGAVFHWLVIKETRNDNSSVS